MGDLARALRACGFRFLKSSREWEPDESAAVGVLAEVIAFDSLYDMEQLSLNQRVVCSSPTAPTKYPE